MPSAKILLSRAAGIAVLAILAGCTVIPKAIKTPAQASFDGNTQNSGLIGDAPGGGFVITTHLRDRYNALVSTYGDSTMPDGVPAFVPAIRKDDGLTDNKDGTWTIDKEHAVALIMMVEWARSGITPVAKSIF